MAPDLQSLDRKSWYAVYCKPLKEWLAATALREYLALTVYVPQIKTHFRGRIRRAPFFPRYLFLQADLQVTSFSQINATSGVIGLVTLGDQPQSIPAAVIETLRQRMEQFNAEGGLPSHGFHPGDGVRLKAGPLQGLEAVFVGPMKPSERVRILVDFLGRRRAAEVHVNTLERSSSVLAPKRERRTRGKGRQINLKG